MGCVPGVVSWFSQKMSTKTLLLVDGNAVAYRAFYAIRELSTHDGRPTNAVFGFIKMLNQLQEVYKPTHRAVVFDGGLPEERMEKLPTYKAQREPMPDLLSEQFDVIEEFLDLAGIVSIRVEGQEADDVIATLVRLASSEGADVLMATSDKDLFQLIDDHVWMVPPSKLGARLDSDGVIEKTGVTPEKIVEWLALIGDSVDNIPGVPGVGPKTAAKLLNQFGSIEGIWEGLEQVSSPKLKEKLAEHRGTVERNLGLVKLRMDLPLELDWNSFRVRQPVPSRLIPFYDHLEFNSFAAGMRELEKEGPMLDFGE